MNEELFKEEEEPKKKKTKKEKKEVVYAYEGVTHHPGEKEPCKICLTEDDLDPAKDPTLAPLIQFMSEAGPDNEYNRMPVLRELQGFLRANHNRLKEEFIRYKKRGRIKPLAELNKK
jgi:hypothetical protein